MGDEILQKVAQIIENNALSNSVVGRLGGDEFILTMMGNSESACKVAQHIITQCSNIHKSIQAQCTTTVSIGIAQNHNDNKDLRSWFDLADKALYQAKANGKDQFQLYSVE